MPIKRLLAVLLAALCLLLPVSAESAAEDTLADQVEAFMAERGLTERNFSMYYHDTVTGEEYCFNETAMMVAASTFKLPLNMYFYEMEAAGDIAPDAWIPRAGATLAHCHEMSLLWSDNPSSIGMLYYLGNFRAYKDCMRKYFTVTDEELDPKYYANNYYSTSMMMDALKYLYAHQEAFPQLLDYLKQAQPDAYFKKYITDCPIAHKYGSFEGAENDVGIIYADRPFLLAVYTQGVGEDISARIALIAKEYADRQHAAAVAEEEARLKAEEEAGIKAEEEARQEAARQEALRLEQQRQKRNRNLILGSSAAGICLAVLILLAAKKRKKAKV